MLFTLSTLSREKLFKENEKEQDKIHIKTFKSGVRLYRFLNKNTYYFDGSKTAFKFYWWVPSRAIVAVCNLHIIQIQSLFNGNGLFKIEVFSLTMLFKLFNSCLHIQRQRYSAYPGGGCGGAETEAGPNSVLSRVRVKGSITNKKKIRNQVRNTRF